MANEKNKINPLLKQLYIAPLDTETKVNYDGVGRFKLFWAYFKEYMSKGLTAWNLLCFLFFLPVFAVWACGRFFGVETIALYFADRAANFYLLSDFGIGMSAGDSIAAASANIVTAYRYLTYIACACLPIGFLGLAGLFNLTNKIVLKKPFATKKNKFGGDTPRPVYEFFLGIKKRGLQYFVSGVFASGVFIGFATLIFDLAEASALGTVSAGNVVGVVFSAIFLLLLAMWLVLYLPSVSAYKINFLQVARNSGIFTLSFFVPTLFILIVTAAPFLLTLAGTIFELLIVFLAVFFGFSFVALAWTVYAETYGEKFLTPLYENVSAKAPQKSAKPAAKNNVNAGSAQGKKPQQAKKPVAYSNPKKKKK